MKREAIERLAMDSAAGELNEDLEALFREYLSEHSEAKPDSEEMARIYQETAAVIEAKTRNADADVGVPAVKVNRVSEATWRSFGRWAAALIFGTLIGFTGGRWTTTDEMSRITFIKPERPPVQVKTLSDLKEEYAGTFWGKKALALMEQGAAKRHRAEFRDVGFWQKYRKEIRYE